MHNGDSTLWSVTHSYTNQEVWLSQVYRTLSTATGVIAIMHVISSPHWQSSCSEIIEMCTTRNKLPSIHLICPHVDEREQDHAVIEEWVRECGRSIAPYGHRINGIANIKHRALVGYLLDHTSRFLSGAYFDEHGIMVRNGCSIAERIVAQHWYTTQRTHVQ